jgi:hypothetical protein
MVISDIDPFAIVAHDLDETQGASRPLVLTLD